MYYRFLFALFAVASPLVASSYAPAGVSNAIPYSAGGSLDELVQAAAGSAQAAQSITANAEVQPSPAEAARLGNVQSQVQALNSNPTYNNVKNSENIAESLAESSLASNIRQGNVNLVPPNLVEQDVHRSLLVPSGPNNHQVIATQPLPPIIVNQPGAPPAQVSSGPAAIVRAAPVIYKLKPSVIFQQEVINKVPTPLSLNPVYVKVYKPGQQITAPTAPVVQQSQQANNALAFGAGASAIGGAGSAVGLGGSAIGVGAPAIGAIGGVGSVLGAAGSPYGAASSPYGAAGSSYGAGGSSYGAAGSSYGASVPAYGVAAPSYGAAAPSYGAAAPSYGGAAPSYGAAAPSYGGAAPSYGAAAPASQAYGAVAPAYGGAGTAYAQQAAPAYQQASY